MAVDFCLRQAGTSLAGVHRVVFYDKPFLKLNGCWKPTWHSPPRGPLVSS